MRKILIGVLIAVLLGAGFFFLRYQPGTLEIEDAQIQLDTLTTQELELRARVAALRKIEARLVEYRDAVNQMNVSVPASPDMDTLILELNQLAVDSGVTWSAGSWSVPGDPDDLGLRSVPVTITVSGQYFEILGYLYGISEMDRLIRVDALSFSPTLQEDGFNVISVSINATTFTTGSITVPAVPEVVQESTTTTTTTTTPGGATTTTTAGG